MAFEYGCFISYAHDDGDLIKHFLDDFLSGLKAYLTGLDNERKYWLDTDRLSGGHALEDTIAPRMCESACWVLIYIPKYRRKTWCQREFRAMCELEASRRKVLGTRLGTTKKMIIPVVLNGHVKDLPKRLPAEVAVEDFSQFSVSQPRIFEHPEFESRMRNIAQHIWDVWRLCENFDDIPSGCDTFVLPQPDPTDWGPEFGGPSQARPR